MIAWLCGKVKTKSPQGLVVDCHGVGYGVLVSASTLSNVGDVGSDVELFVHTHVGQDVLRLYGFANAKEQQTFEVLISIPGVGPRLALAIQSVLTSAELSEAVFLGEKSTLTRIPGIGSKKAEKLLVELKHRLPEKTDQHAIEHVTGLDADLCSALLALGFKPKEAEQLAKDTIRAHATQTDLAALVRLALHQP